jgi:hypothetical protein
MCGSRRLSVQKQPACLSRGVEQENLLFTEDWQLKVCDYGVSVCLKEERAVTRTGSREYMAPVRAQLTRKGGVAQWVAEVREPRPIAGLTLRCPALPTQEVNVCPLKRGPDDNKANEALAYTPAVDVWCAGTAPWCLSAQERALLQGRHHVPLPPYPRAGRWAPSCMSCWWASRPSQVGVRGVGV